MFYHREDSQHTQNIQINIIIVAMNSVILWKKKNHMDLMADPIFFTIVTMWYITTPWLIYFITGGLYLLSSITHFAQPQTPTLATNKLFSFSMGLIFCLFFSFIYVRSYSICLSLTYFTGIMLSKSIHVATHGKIYLSLRTNNIPLYASPLLHPSVHT